MRLRRHSLGRTIPAIVLVTLVAAPASADWLASGTFHYEDREWDQNGFTGIVTERPVRFADVQVVDANERGKKAILGEATTGADGSFSISISDSSRRTVYVRALTRSKKTSDLHAEVVTHDGAFYAVRSADVAGHDPGTDVDFGVLVATVHAGSEAFNMFDLLVYGADYIESSEGARPAKKNLVSVHWEIDGGVTGGAYTSGKTIVMRDYAAYDDTVVLHEWGHYAMNVYSSNSNPGGAHALADCDQNPRLSFDEGRASALGCGVRRFNGFPNANIYVRTSGASGPGGVQNWFDLEDEVQYACDGATSEVTVSRALWDISDSSTTTDTTPGTEDAHDLLARPDLEVWRVNADFLDWPVTAESFWDGWFEAGHGYLSGMKGVFDHLSIEYAPDGFEPNETVSEARSLVADDSPVHLTFFSDPDGDGVGQPDTDVFRFQATSGVTYTVETLSLLSGADTSLDLLDSDGQTVLETSDDRSASDLSSIVVWTAPRTDIFYVRLEQVSVHGDYGSYDLRLAN